MYSSSYIYIHTPALWSYIYICIYTCVISLMCACIYIYIYTHNILISPIAHSFARFLRFDQQNIPTQGSFWYCGQLDYPQSWRLKCKKVNIEIPLAQVSFSECMQTEITVQQKLVPFVPGIGSWENLQNQPPIVGGQKAYFSVDFPLQPLPKKIEQYLIYYHFRVK